jgi:polar amino acid transport system substrate-binding protein
MWIVLGKPKGDIMKKISIIIVCVLLVLTCSLTACNQENQPLYYGLDMEIAQGLAQELGMELVIINWLNFDTICTEVSNYTNGIVMAGLTYSEKRAEIVNFSSTYYSASQKIIVKASDTTFDACKTAAEIEAILKAYDNTVKIGAQSGTTGYLYCKGDADWGFDGYAFTTVGYNTGALAVQDIINGNLKYVIIDEGPAKAITTKINSIN